MKVFKVFNDTNTFLHFLSVDQINWQKVVGTATITIVVPRLVLNELDKAKRGASPKLIKKAQEVLKVILASNGRALTPNITIEVALSLPPDAIFEEHGLDKREQDHVLIASILHYGEAHPDDEIVLVTDDTVIQLTAPGFGIRVATLPDKYRIVDTDETEKKLKQAQQELAKLKNARPILDVNFDSDSKVIEVEIVKPNFEEYKEYQLQKRISEYPKLSEYSFSPEYKPLPELIEQYNKYLDLHYDSYGSYLNGTKDAHVHTSLSFPLAFKIDNTGSVPADEVELTLKFPPWVSVNYEVKSQWPERIPYPPSFDRHVVRPGGVTPPPAHPILNPNALRGLSSDLKITTKKDGDEVSIDFKSLKHKTAFVTGEIFVTVNEFDCPTGFSIKYTLHANNITDIISEKLNIKLKKLE